MTKETKLTHNITATLALKLGNEASALRKNDEQRLEVSQMKYLRHFIGVNVLV